MTTARLQTPSWSLTLLLVIALGLTFHCVHAQPPRDNGAGPTQLLSVQPESATEQARARIVCDPQFRLLNGVCTNPFFRLWGSTNRAQSSLFFTHSSEFPTGTDLPSARFISNALFKQSTDKFNDRDLNEFLVFFGQFIDHTYVATPVGSEPMPIPIPTDDPIFANFTNGELKFTRSRRARVDILGLFGSAASSVARRIPSILSSQPEVADQPGVTSDAPSLTPTLGSPPASIRQPVSAGNPTFTAQLAASNPRAPSGSEGPNAAPAARSLPLFFGNERPANSLTSALDLSSVYGVDTIRNNALRDTGGKLKVGPDDVLPLNEPNLNNAPTSEDIYFLAGDHRANEHPVLTSLHTIFVREHNDICDELKDKFPTWTDDEIYKTARKINEAQFQKVVFEEFYPAITGRELPTYKGFRFYRNVNIIDVFSTAAFRVGHTMVGNQISRRGPGNSNLPSIPFMEMFFRLASQFSNVEEFLRGAMQTNAQEIDLQVHDSLRNFLFTGIPEEGIGFDLISLNIQRGRDHALPTYNAIRQRLGLGVAGSFADITSNANVQSALLSVYGSVNDVEAWIGLIGEDHAAGSSLGPTMLALWERQFTNLRDGDRFFFRNNIFSSEVRTEIPRVNAIFSTNELMREILLRNSDVKADEIPPSIFFKT